MLSNTKLIFEQTVKDLKRADFVRALITLLISIGNLIYRIATDAPLLPLTVVLLVINTAYLVFFIVYATLHADKNKVLKKNVTQIYKWSKRLFLAIMAYLTVASFIDAPRSASPLSIAFAIILPVSLLLQVVFDFIIYYVTTQIKLLKESLEADLKSMAMPFTNPVAYGKSLLAKKREAKLQAAEQTSEYLEIAATTSSDKKSAVSDTKKPDADTQTQKKRNIKKSLLTIGANLASAIIVAAVKLKKGGKTVKEKEIAVLPPPDISSDNSAN